MEKRVLKKYFHYCAASGAVTVAAVFFVDLFRDSNYWIATILGSLTTLLNLKVTSLLLSKVLVALASSRNSSSKPSGLAALFILKSLLLLSVLILIGVAALIPGLERAQVFFFLTGFLSFIPGTLVFSLTLQKTAPEGQ